ncbi:substrate-binding periplasmic protein [Thalassotalea castellviae]|uniref:Transporter substrate-binding domain-containing protein n=1 Tax=Thalassotalea castellviae TaxID=3075612 RepID=A0ABU2ZWL5_9GAMM|nr:transporter substrate-binding domain-containing protein [Thalassotalea sp. W431]MDT0602319.1 transporter substrate-binding domain-containing protein [Thalassotalea sp. W431]
MKLNIKKFFIRLLTLMMVSLSSISVAEQLIFVAEDLPPYHFNGQNNQPTGILVDLIDAVMLQAKIPYKIELMPFARIYTVTHETPNVVMLSLMKSDDRAAEFKWIGKSFKSKAFLVGLKNREDINIKNLEQAKQHIVGTIRGYHSEKYLKDAGFTVNKNMHLSVNYKHMWNMLFEQHIDFILTNFIAIEKEMTSIGFKQSDIKAVIELTDFPGDLFLATGLSTPDKTVDKLSKALAQIKENGTYDKIMSKWGA